MEGSIVFFDGPSRFSCCVYYYNVCVVRQKCVCCDCRLGTARASAFTLGFAAAHQGLGPKTTKGAGRVQRNDKENYRVDKRGREMMMLLF